MQRIIKKWPCGVKADYRPGSGTTIYAEVLCKQCKCKHTSEIVVDQDNYNLIEFLDWLRTPPDAREFLELPNVLKNFSKKQLKIMKAKPRLIPFSLTNDEEIERFYAENNIQRSKLA